MKAEECVSRGGHCWEDMEIGLYRNAAGTFKNQKCKHCGATRRGKARDPWEWTYFGDES